MKPRIGLHVALVGLVIAVPCGVAALFIASVINGPLENGWAAGVVLVYVGLFIGFIVMLVGLALAVAAAMMKPS